MKHLSTRFVALLCVVSCVTVAAIEIWPAVQRVRTADENGDGRPDIWRHYDNRGQLAEVDVDSNFDGRPDIEEYYERGLLVRRESDRNFNGQADLVEEFDAQTHGHTRSVVDVDYDGTADLLVLFRDGRPVFSEGTWSSKRSDVPRHDLPAVDQSSTDHLARLTDPFESDSSVRAARIASTDEGCVGLSTSGGLPRPRVMVLNRPSPSLRLAARDVEPHAPTLLLPRSPRAPPIS